MVHRIDFKSVKSAASFERVLLHYGIELRGRGDQRKALCPFHSDTKPSLNVNLRTKVFNCFPCGDGGDIIKFVAKMEHRTDPDGHRIEAAEKLAEICGISIAQDRTEAPTKAQEQREGPSKENTTQGASKPSSRVAREGHRGSNASRRSDA